MWTATDITIVLSADDTDDPVVTTAITTPAGTLRAMAEAERIGRVSSGISVGLRKR